VRFLSKIREEKKFASIEAMVAQMDKDAAAARDYFASPASSAGDRLS
jgi:FAD synthase